MCSIIGVGERLHKVWGQIDFGTLDSGERSLPFGLLVSVLIFTFYIINQISIIIKYLTGRAFLIFTIKLYLTEVL